MDKQIEIEMDIIRRKWKRSYYKYSGQDDLERGEKKMYKKGEKTFEKTRVYASRY